MFVDGGVLMGMKAPVSHWLMTAEGKRVEWSEFRDRVDLGVIATALLGPAPGRHGQKAGRLWWRCPFHEDKNPSFFVTKGKPEWRCYGCHEHGDAPALVMRLQKLKFPEAVRWLAEQVGFVTPSGQSKVRPRITDPPKGGRFLDSEQSPAAANRIPDQPSGIPLADALVLVETAEKSLWLPEGLKALAYLRNRGLKDETIKAARLGVTFGVLIPKKDGTGVWKARGVTIPWFDDDRLAMVKIRQPEGREPKYGEAFRDRPAVFPAPSRIRPGKPLIVCEGEFDAILLRQELAEHDLAVVTLGSASNRTGHAVQDLMLTAPIWYLALDSDQAGNKNAEAWPGRAKRVKPPDPCKDWGEVHAAGRGMIRQHWAEILGRPHQAAEPTETRPPSLQPPWPPRPPELAEWPIERVSAGASWPTNWKTPAFLGRITSVRLTNESRQNAE